MPAVVFAIDSLLGGGAEKITITLAEGFIEQGYEAHIIIFESGVNYRLPRDIKLHSVEKQSNERKGPNRFKKAAAAVDNILADIQKRTEIIGVISNLTYTDRVLHYSKFPRILFCIHNHPSQYWDISGNFFRRINRLRKLRALYRQKHLVCVSKGVEENLKSLGVKPRSLRTIYNPFDISLINQLAQETPRIPLDFDYVICVGSFKSQKRHDRLLKVYSQANIPAKLLLLGQGSPSQEAALRRLAKQYGVEDKVIFHGFEENPYPYISRAKALLLSSDYEGLPTVIIESLICGTPVVSTNCPSGPNEILTGDQKRFLVPVDDTELFSKKIHEVLESPPALTDLDLGRFDARTAVSLYEAALRELN